MYYNASTGRFLSTDPFEGNRTNAISRHRYLYANANPVTFSDPSGRFSLLDLLGAETIQRILRSKQGHAGKQVVDMTYKKFVELSGGRILPRLVQRGAREVLDQADHEVARRLTREVGNYLAKNVRNKFGEFACRQVVQRMRDVGRALESSGEREIGLLIIVVARGALSFCPK